MRSCIGRLVPSPTGSMLRGACAASCAKSRMRARGCMVRPMRRSTFAPDCALRACQKGARRPPASCPYGTGSCALKATGRPLAQNVLQEVGDFVLRRSEGIRACYPEVLQQSWKASGFERIQAINVENFWQLATPVLEHRLSRANLHGNNSYSDDMRQARLTPRVR